MVRNQTKTLAVMVRVQTKTLAVMVRIQSEDEEEDKGEEKESAD